MLREPEMLGVRLGEGVHRSKELQPEPIARTLAALRELIGSSTGANADAAGRLYGSLDAGTAQAVKLITQP